MTTARVSVLITAKNAQRTIAQAIKSIELQTGSVHEVVAIDDGSSDSTYETIMSTAKSSGLMIKARRLNPGIGRPKALNEALRIARGDYIAILDADDYWAPTKIAHQLDRFLAKPNLSVLGTQYYRFGPWGGPDLVNSMPETAVEVERSLRKGVMPVAHSTMIARRSTFELVGGYHPRMVRAQDFQWLRRVCQAGMEIENLSEALMYYWCQTRSQSVAYWAKNERFRRYAIKTTPIHELFRP